VIASLVPIMVGVAMASAAELTFNWMGFLTAMVRGLRALDKRRCPHGQQPYCSCLFCISN
jgi:hypothetical protein